MSNMSFSLRVLVVHLAIVALLVAGIVASAGSLRWADSAAASAADTSFTSALLIRGAASFAQGGTTPAGWVNSRSVIAQASLSKLSTVSCLSTSTKSLTKSVVIGVVAS